MPAIARPRDETHARLIAALNAARDATPERTDQALAKRLSITSRMLSNWRNGRWSHNDRVLIQLLTETRA